MAGLEANVQQQQEFIRVTNAAVEEATAVLPDERVADGTAKEEDWFIDPKARIVALGSEIERLLRRPLSMLQIPPPLIDGMPNPAWKPAIIQTASINGLSVGVVSSLQSFIAVRNQIIHDWDSSVVLPEVVESSEKLRELIENFKLKAIARDEDQTTRQNGASSEAV